MNTPAKSRIHYSYTLPKRGFTLIELLAVVAIVGVLIAIIIPVVGYARVSAHTSKCASQARTLALAHALYRQDNQGLPPPSTIPKTDPASEGGGKIWGLLALRRYYRGDAPYIYSNGSFLIEATEKCPSVATNGMTVNAERGGPDYGVLTRSIKYDYFYTQPSRTPLIWDGWSPGWNSTNTMPLRHNGAINTAFLDGHVERIKQTDGRLYSAWWTAATVEAQPDASKLGQGTPLGSLVPDS